jgi:ankyrin repeat protein
MPLDRRKLILIAAGAMLAAASVLAQTTPPASAADALAEAARSGNAAAVAKLLDAGLDVNTQFRYGATALSYACDHGNLAVVKLLLERGADVNVKDTFYGATPLTWASSPALKRKPEHAEIVGLLLKRGATGKDGALLSATSEGDAAMTKVILELGGLPAETMSDALEAAQATKHAEIAAMLEAAGAKPAPVLNLDDTQLARYAGSYRSASGNLIPVTVKDGHLVVTAGLPLQLVARSETVFVAPSQGVKVTFTLEGGKAVSFTIGATTYTRSGGH